MVAALAVWKLSQYLSKSRNFGSMVAVLAVLPFSMFLYLVTVVFDEIKINY